MDLARKTQYFTLDVITDLAFGQPFGDLLADEDLHRYIESTQSMLQVILTLGAIPVLSDILAIKWIGDLAFSDKDEIGIGKLIGYVILWRSKHRQPEKLCVKHRRKD